MTDSRIHTHTCKTALVYVCTHHSFLCVCDTVHTRDVWFDSAQCVCVLTAVGIHCISLSLVRSSTQRGLRHSVHPYKPQCIHACYSGEHEICVRVCDSPCVHYKSISIFQYVTNSTRLMFPLAEVSLRARVNCVPHSAI